MVGDVDAFPTEKQAQINVAEQAPCHAEQAPFPEVGALKIRNK